MSEVWRPVYGVDGYQVSNEGSVRGPRRVLRQHLDDGYPKVTLCPGNGVRLPRRVHTLVLEAFVAPRPEGMVGRHLDGVRTNNHLSNLMWGTQSENEVDKILHGTDNSGERSGRAKLTWDDVREIRSIYRPRSRGLGNRALAKRYGVGPVTMLKLIKGDTWRRDPNGNEA